MKNNKAMMWVLVILWSAGLWYMMNNQQKAGPPPKPTVMMEQARKLEEKAGNDKKALGKIVIPAYQAVAYRRVLITMRPVKTELASEARLRIGIIQETKLKQSQQAIHTYTALTRDVPPAKSEISKEAEVRLSRLRDKLDKRGSQQIGYKAFDYLVALTGRNPKFSYALALLIISLLVKLITSPLSHVQFKYMREMQKLQPQIKQLQAKYKDSQQELGRKTMELYKQHGVNPFASCLPLLIQMPILILLYYKLILAYQFRFAQGEFLWIGSGLAERFPAIIGANLAQPDMLLLLIYTVSMIVSQKLTIVDPTQAQQQKIMAYMMPLMFAFFFRSFPSALMLYWFFSNVLNTAQQYYVIRQPSGTAGPGAGPTGEDKGGTPVELPKPPKKPSTGPSRSKRRRRRFDVWTPRPVLQPIPGG